jgi:beta-mannosidase
MLSVAIPEAGISVDAPVTILPGLHPVETTVEVTDPQLWWPAGHGEQPLYTVSASVTLDGKAAPIGSGTRRVGFRHVRVNQDPHPAGGSYFVIEINGKPIFIKGGNFVPADMIPARLDRQRYATLVDRALEANFNMLRIWGGGLYENDDLYEICDERGVLLWQEFIFACAKYPVHDEKYLADVTREATYQVRRLANHPSLIVWCGNNEMEEGAYHWNFDKGVAHPDYALFHLTLPVILKQEDGSRYYQPSSPFSPDNESPRRDDMGDQHPWTIGFGDTDFRKYRQMAPRFPNEGGILGANSLPTTLACLPEGQRHPHSLAWRVHDNGVATWGDVVPYPDTMLLNWLGKPVKEMTVEDYVYWAGLVQGEGLTEYIRNFHRRMFDTSSAIFWMYNDCWPTTRSWTIVDYYLRRTPSFHPVRRAFAPLTVALAVEGDQVRVYGVNEGAAWQGELRYGVFNLAGGYPIDASCDVTLPANASSMLAEFPLDEWERLGVNDHAAFAILSRDGEEAARDRLFLPLFKEMDWPAAEVSVRRENGSAIFESPVFAWRVCLDLDGDRALPDNFFDVFPGIPTVLDWPEGLGEPRVLRVGNMV